MMGGSDYMTGEQFPRGGLDKNLPKELQRDQCRSEQGIQEFGLNSLC